MPQLRSNEPILGLNNVIQIHHYKSIGEISHDIFHHPHESCWRICQTNGMTNHSKRPSFELKVGFHTYVCSIGTWWYPDFISILLKYLAPMR
jgi:hypothetical protein